MINRFLSTLTKNSIDSISGIFFWLSPIPDLNTTMNNKLSDFAPPIRCEIRFFGRFLWSQDREKSGTFRIFEKNAKFYCHENFLLMVQKTIIQVIFWFEGMSLSECWWRYSDNQNFCSDWLIDRDERRI